MQRTKRKLGWEQPGLKSNEDTPRGLSRAKKAPRRLEHRVGIHLCHLKSNQAKAGGPGWTGCLEAPAVALEDMTVPALGWQGESSR